MICLQKLSIAISSNLFKQNSRRYLRISVQNITSVTKYPAKIISQNRIQWDQKIQIPVLYNKEFGFQVFEKHQFGYNPQQFNNMICGTLIIRNVDEKYNNWEVYDSKSQKLGYLSANITQKSLKKNILPSHLATQKAIMRNTTQNQQKFAYIYINSIVAHLSQAQTKRAYTIIKIGDKTIKTSNVKSRSGQIVFIEGYETQKSQNDTLAIFQVHSYDPKNNLSQLIAIGQLKLDAEKPQKKVLLYNKQGQINGQMYVQSKQCITKALGYNNEINSSRVLGSSRYRYPAPQDSLPAYGIISPLKSTSRLDYSTGYHLMSSSRIKRLSVVAKNSDIVFPRQRRFLHYKDKTSDVISYLSQNERDFTFLNRKTNKYYRGASLGYGNKADFTKESLSNPGVGRYKLPTIWDRY